MSDEKELDINDKVMKVLHYLEKGAITKRDAVERIHELYVMEGFPPF